MRQPIRARVDEEIRFFSSPCSWSSNSNSSRFFVLPESLFPCVLSRLLPRRLLASSGGLCSRICSPCESNDSIKNCLDLCLRVSSLSSSGLLLVWFLAADLPGYENLLWVTLTLFSTLASVSWHTTSCFSLSSASVGCNNCGACNTSLQLPFLLTLPLAAVGGSITASIS